MPWYKAGTVSVAQNSNVVTGSGTAFIANARAGDAFLGPDGGWYEVTNIASNTAMSISPNYRGASSAAGAYSIVPVNGYSKDLADAFNSLNNQFGAQLAALGTTGNYDILPVTKGGTGGATPADARLGLDLVKTTSATDNTAGRIVKVGDFGQNGGDAITLAATISANDVQVEGKYAFPNGGLMLPAASTPYFLEVTKNGTSVIQRAHGMVAAVASRSYTRILSSNGWSAWDQKASAGANSDITSLAGLTTALSLAQGGTGVTTIAALVAALVAAGVYSKAGAVGTVSQTSGVPTGALFERISNANGEAVKMADGTLICWRNIGEVSGYPVAVGAVQASNAYLFPATFVGAVARSYQGYPTDASGNNLSLPINDYSPATSVAGWQFSIRNNSAIAVTRVAQLQFIATGRWY